jgi:hypothetical protein
MPNVWLVRSEEYEVELYEDVLNLLQSIPGVLSFHAGALIDADTPIIVDDGENIPGQNFFSDIYKIRRMSDHCFYDQCRQFRLKKDVGEDEIVVLLTNKNNALNHFNGLEFGREKNLFVQTSDWEHYFPGSDVRYPVAYHVAVSVLIALWFRSEEEAIARIHSKARGCIMDFCGNKSEVSLKMRTADICESCLQHLSESGLGANVVNHTLRILEDIRRNMLFKAVGYSILNRKSCRWKASNNGCYFRA